MYKLQKFVCHLKDCHDITIEDYLEKYIFYNIPICQCGCGKKTNLNFKLTQKDKIIVFNKYINNHHFKDEQIISKHSAFLKRTRVGEGNPMYKKEPWNKGLTKETNQSLKMISDKKTGKKCSETAKKNMSIAAKKRTVHGHTGKLHST